MEKKQLHLIVLFLAATFSLCKLSYSQGEANFWYFGTNAGLDFNSGVPVALSNGQVNTDEGSAAVSDAAGNLLFYTDGLSVWNRIHRQMPNGFGLMGGISSTQSALILKKPGSSFIYYIFTANQQYSTTGIKYSEVDMMRDGGLGDVTEVKNISLHSASCEKITAVKHCNGHDIWVITHDWDADTFRVFLVTSSGVSSTEVVSSAGLFLSGNQNKKIGYLKASPNGSKLASAIWGSEINRFELFDFNRATGTVSNPILFPLIPAGSGAYGVEFSPDGTKLYGSVLNPATVYQFNLCAGSNSDIANSGILIGTSSSIMSGALQLGPDNKIYVAKYFSNSLGVIDDPNALGTDCHFIDCGVPLGFQYSSIGLPNFMTGSSRVTTMPFLVEIACNTALFSVSESTAASCGSTEINSIVSTFWDFGDPGSGSGNFSDSINPVHFYSQAGTYNVLLVLYRACGIDSIIQNITIRQNLHFAELTGDDAICYGEHTVISASGGVNYLWSTGENTSSIQVSPDISANYQVIATNELGCTDTLTKKIFVNIKPEGKISGNLVICTGNNSVLQASGGKSFIWNTGETQSSISVNPGESSEYSVIVNNGFCEDTASIKITVLALPEINVHTLNSTQSYTKFNVSGGESYQWYPSNGLSCTACSDPIATPTETTTYCLTVTGGNGCIDSTYLTTTISIIFIPNAFSPDQNSINDVFKPIVKNVHNYQFLIFNRWGDKVFHTSDPEEGWDGYYRGNLCEQSSYVYKINFVDDERKTFHEYMGNVTLLR